jgi:hypothetical protein
MLDEGRLREILQLQRKSYELLRWANDAAKARRINFRELHVNMSTWEAARAWIERHYSSLPEAARPEREQVEEYAHLFASYLLTSFQPAQRQWISDGCPCAFCSFFVDVPQLQGKTPTRRDQELAAKLKVSAVEKLALSLELPLFREELERFLNEEPNLQHDIALLTWVLELFRRGEFRGQGEAVLALWREIAWKKGKPDRKFEVTAETVLAAEAHVADALKRFAAAR